MKTKFRKFLIAFILGFTLVFAGALCACDKKGGKDDPEPEPIHAVFTEEGTATLEKVTDGAVVSVSTSSDFLVISADAAFSVKVGDEPKVNSENNTLTIANTGASFAEMTFVVTCEGEITLSLQLSYKEGTMENPYLVSGERVLVFTAEACFKPVSGWYTFTALSETFALSNYDNVTSGSTVYLSEKVYSLNCGDFSPNPAERSVKISPVSAPAGYSAESALAITLEDAVPVSCEYYAGVKAYFAFEASAEGDYVISLVPNPAYGSDDVSYNARFKATDGETSYGRYYEDGGWEEYDALVMTVHLASGEKVTIEADYSLSESMVGSRKISAAVYVASEE